MPDHIPSIEKGPLQRASSAEVGAIGVAPNFTEDLAAARTLDPTNPADVARAHELGKRIAANQEDVRVLGDVVDVRILNPHRDKSPDQPETLTIGEALVFCGKGMASMVGNMRAMAETFGAEGDAIDEGVRLAVKTQAQKERKNHPELFANAEQGPIGSEKK